MLYKKLDEYNEKNICIIIYGNNIYTILEPIFYNETNKDIVKEYINCVFKKIAPYNDLTYNYNYLCKYINERMNLTHNIIINI